MQLGSLAQPCRHSHDSLEDATLGCALAFLNALMLPIAAIDERIVNGQSRWTTIRYGREARIIRMAPHNITMNGLTGTPTAPSVIEHHLRQAMMTVSELVKQVQEFRPKEIFNGGMLRL